MNPPLAITAVSLLTPLDTPTRTTWQALQCNQRVRHQRHVSDTFLPALLHVDRSIRLAIAVADRLRATHPLPKNTALFTATSKGPITTALRALDSLNQNHLLHPAVARQITLGPAALNVLLAEHLHLPPGHTSVAACASGLHALHNAAHALWRNEAPAALVVAADASLHPLFEASFRRLGILSPPTPEGAPQCHPFSEAGAGFFLTEAATAILLERPDEPRSTNRDPQFPLAHLTHSWIGADASALLAIDPDTHSLRHGLKTSLPTSPLAFIHAHATGTAHDAYELAALHASLTPPYPPIFSTKSHLGHSLGAAGLLSLALSALSHHHGTTPLGSAIHPNLPSLTIAQGFGGHIAIARLQRSAP